MSSLRYVVSIDLGESGADVALKRKENERLCVDALSAIVWIQQYEECFTEKERVNIGTAFTQPIVWREQERFSTLVEEKQFYRRRLHGNGRDLLAARQGLANLLEVEGALDEAASLLEQNARAGLMIPILCIRLSSLCERIGDLSSAEAALAEARRLEQEGPRLVAKEERAATSPVLDSDWSRPTKRVQALTFIEMAITRGDHAELQSVIRVLQAKVAPVAEIYSEARRRHPSAPHLSEVLPRQLP